MIRVAIVEDDAAFARTLARSFERRGYDVLAADSHEALLGLLEQHKALEHEIVALKAKAAVGATADLAARAQMVGGVRVLAARLEGFDAKALREAVDRLKQQLGDAVIVLAGAQDGKVALVAGVAGAALGKVKAGDVLGEVAREINGKGGGRPDLAQGGGEDGPALGPALEAVTVAVERALGQSVSKV